MASRRRGRHGPPVDAVVGVAAWVVIFAASTGPLADRIGLLEGLWLLGPLAVTPIGLALLRPPAELGGGLRPARWMALPAAGFVVASILAEPGTLSALLCVPWALVAGASLVVGLRWVARAPSGKAKLIVPVAGLVFLALGALSLIAWRGQFRPLGLSDTTAALTAVHLTFAGFGAAVVADRTRAAATRRRNRSVAAGAGLVTVAATAVLVAGFLTESSLVGLVGSALLAGGLVVMASVMMVYTLRKERAPGSTALLVVSAASVLFALALGVQFAFAQWSDAYTLSATRMLELHGTVASLGFVVGGLIGWTLAELPSDV